MDTSIPSKRDQHLDEIAAALPVRANSLARLFRTHTSVEATRTEMGVISTLADGPRRITELAAAEGVTQPAMTMVINRLEERGWVARRSDPTDARAVLAVLMPAGGEVIEQMRVEYRALVHEEMASLSDDDVAALSRAVEVLDQLIDRLKERA
jgi:DNA-binding MarR family transcriptional regulator